MSGPILILPVAGRAYVARTDRGLTAEGSTPEQALANLRQQANQYHAERLKEMLVEPPAGDHPWLAWAGTWDPADPMIQEWQRAVEEHRRAQDADPQVL